MIKIIDPGTLTLVQDLGRFGYRHLGVSWSGAFDCASANQANDLLANPRSAALLEILLGGLTVAVDIDTHIALTGAPCPAVWDLHGVQNSATFETSLWLPAGSHLKLGTPTRGVRTYLAVAGGIASESVLGSSSYDTLGELGPDPLKAGDVLATGSPAIDTTGPLYQRPLTQNSERSFHPKSQATDLSGPDLVAALAGAGTTLNQLNSVAATTKPGDTEIATLTAHPTVHSNLILGNLAELLAERIWMVGAQTSRIGVRMSGKQLPIDYPRSWGSEPTLPGSIQIAPNGELIIFGPDSPTTGGYPVIAVADRKSLDTLSQLRPGSRLEIKILEHNQ